MRERRTTNFIDYLAFAYINNIDDHFERSKVRMLLWVATLFGVFLLCSAPTFLATSPLILLIYASLLVTCISVPFFINAKQEHILPAKILLSLIVATNFGVHLIANPSTINLTGIWFIVLIMVGSFILGKRWTFVYILITLLALLITPNFSGQYLKLETLLSTELSTIGEVNPIQIVIPFLLIYFILAAFIDNKKVTDQNVLQLLQEQKALNGRLQKKETKFRKIIEGVDDMIYELDEKGRFTFMNPAIKKVTGYNMEDKRAVFTKPITKEYKETTLGFFRQQMKDQTSLTYLEFPIYTKSGSVIWLGQKTNMIFDTDGKMLTALCLGRDITTQKKTEQQLIEAKEKAIKASLVKAQFLSSMSHEIRTPMNAVIGLIHLLLEENPRNNQVDHLNTLMFSANNLLKLINNILDFSKIEAGKIEITNRPFSIGELMKSLQHGFGNQAKEKGIALIINFDKRIPDRIVGDALRLSQILNNLISNAVKFTDEGQVSVDISLQKNLANTLTIHFKIQDTGIGIPKHKLAAVFEDFIQVNEDTLRQGTGLGLSITKELLALQGSRIDLKSTYGQGSTFSFTLDFEKIAPIAAAQMSTQKTKPKIPYSQKTVLAGVQLLLVEDNKINQKVANNFLKKWGVKVDIADNGAIALEMVQQKKYDVVLMDLQMPVMNGIVATKAIRALGNEYLELPIIALTASAVLEVRDHAIESGLDDFVTKPFIPNMLYEKIAQYTELVLNDE